MPDELPGGLVINLSGLQRFKYLQKCRLSRAIACLCPSARTIAVVSLTITLWPSARAAGTPSGPITYTIRGDATAVRR